MKNAKMFVFVCLLLPACAGSDVKKVAVDTPHNRPVWVDDSKVSFEKDDKIYFKAKQTVRGDQRVNGCHVIASHDNREALLRGIADQMRGATDEAQTEISESAELFLGKVRSGEWTGKIYGFHDEEQYFERYQIRDELTKSVTERIDCYTLSSVSKADYLKTKNEVLNKVIAINPKIKEAIAKRQEDFFKGPKPASEKVEESAIEE